MPLFLRKVCFLVDFHREAKRPLRTKSAKRPIKVGKRNINEGKRPIKAMVLVGISVGCLMGCFRSPPPWRKTAPLKRPIKRSLNLENTVCYPLVETFLFFFFEIFPVFRGFSRFVLSLFLSLFQQKPCTGNRSRSSFLAPLPHNPRRNPPSPCAPHPTTPPRNPNTGTGYMGSAEEGVRQILTRF